MLCPDELLNTLRDRGERLTLPRRHVVEVLCEHPDHLTVQDVQSHLKQRAIDLNETTIYRVLQWMKATGLVSQTDLGRSEYVYQLIEPHIHHHLVCLNCGAIIDVDDSAIAPLRATLQAEYDFTPRIDHMAIFGVCAHCRAAPDQTIPSSQADHPSSGPEA